MIPELEQAVAILSHYLCVLSALAGIPWDEEDEAGLRTALGGLVDAARAA